MYLIVMDNSIPTIWQLGKLDGWGRKGVWEHPALDDFHDCELPYLNKHGAANTISFP